MDQLEKVLQEIEQRRRFVVTSHARPDGDAIGSALALAQILLFVADGEVSGPAYAYVSAGTRRGHAPRPAAATTSSAAPLRRPFADISKSS